MNPGKFNKVITIEKLDVETERWSDLLTLRARVNKAKGSEYFSSGAEQSSADLVFDIRYYPVLEDIYLNTQSYRIIFNGNRYNILDYDDYMLQHKSIRLSAVGKRW